VLRRSGPLSTPAATAWPWPVPSVMAGRACSRTRRPSTSRRRATTWWCTPRGARSGPTTSCWRPWCPSWTSAGSSPRPSPRAPTPWPPGSEVPLPEACTCRPTGLLARCAPCATEGLRPWCWEGPVNQAAGRTTPPTTTRTGLGPGQLRGGIRRLPPVAQDYTTVGSVPYVGRSPRTRRIFVATGFKKWGHHQRQRCCHGAGRCPLGT
jgi:hypothetical protein